MTASKPGSSSGKRWTPHAKDKLRVLYPMHPIADILKAFPGRTWQAIHHQANLMGLRRKVLGKRRHAPTKTEFGRILRAERLNRGLSLRALGKIAGYSGEHIGEWERGVYSPLMPSLINWANSLGFELTLARRAA